MIADSVIKKIEASLEFNRLAMESLNSTLEEMHCQLKMKEDRIKCLMTSQEKLEKDKDDLILSKDELASKFVSTIEEMRTLEDFVHLLSKQLVH